MRALRVYSYHYVRDVHQTEFARLNALPTSEFSRQLDQLKSRYEMATLESAVAFLQGEYRPVRDLCLLTFDDGFREHARGVATLLVQHRVQGLFHLITACIEDHWLAPVHMNHFLMAFLGAPLYHKAFLAALHELAPAVGDLRIDHEEAERTYCYDDAATAHFKYLFNFVLDAGVRDPVVRWLFERFLGPPEEFAKELYLSWDDARALQNVGMIIGGHTHRHRPLAALDEAERREDLTTSLGLLHSHLKPQRAWPFSYPYGKRDSFTTQAVTELQQHGFCCAFTMEDGVNHPGCALHTLKRTDCKELTHVQPTALVCAESLH